MNRPAPRGLSAIAAYLRDIATRSRVHTRADHFHDIATQLDQANRELQHLRGLSARLRDHLTPERIELFFAIDRQWRRTHYESDVELASGA